MAACAFFGHRCFPYSRYESIITDYISELIEKKDVTQFYSGYRGEFDRLCARLVSEIKQIYPPIINTMVLSYHPREDFILPSCFDDCVYLLDKIVPPRFAISCTNKKMVEISDYIISGVKHETGGAAFACAYAKRKKKIVISLF